MPKNATTIWMENVITDWGNNMGYNHRIIFYPEVKVDNKNHRVDLQGVYLINSHLVSDSVNVEIKVSYSDLNNPQGYGLNFNGDINYLAVPEKLVKSAWNKLHRMKRMDVGILCVNDDENIDVVKRSVWNGNIYNVGIDLIRSI